MEGNEKNNRWRLTGTAGKDTDIDLQYVVAPSVIALVFVLLFAREELVVVFDLLYRTVFLGGG